MADESFRKVTKDNVWSSNYIDNFKQMIDNHHKSLQSFQRVGTMLETSGRIYSLKVDSLHTDIIHLSTGIRRQNVSEPTAESDTTGDFSIHQPIRRRRSGFATIVGNKQVINSALQVTEEPSSLFIRVNAEQNASVKNLLQNVLASDQYSLSLQSKKKFWIDRSVGTVHDDHDEDDDSAIMKSAAIDLPVLDWIPSMTDVIRPRVTGYEISNTPRECFRYPETSTVAYMNRSNELSMDLLFDINADVVPLNEQSLIPLPGAISASFTEDDQNALRRCTVLQPNIVVTDDLRPVTGSPPLDYSYRRLTDDPLQTTASYWKVPSIIQQNNPKGKKKRTYRRKVAVKDRPVVFQEELNNSTEQNFLSVDDPNVRRIRNANQLKWNPDKLKIPNKMSYSTARRYLPLMIHCRENENPDDPNADENEEAVSVTSNSNEDDEPVPASNSIHDVNEGMILENTSIANQEEVFAFDMDVERSLNVDDVVLASTPVHMPRISLHQPPVPLQLHQFMQITPANFNVKQITKRCLDIINELESGGGEATFAQIYQRLRNDNQVITPSVLFSSILELANKNNFYLEKIGENDFVIKRI